MEDIKTIEKLFSTCETYRTTQSKDGKGTFYYTDCGNRMYSINDEFSYDKKLCPKCGKILLLRGTSYAIDYMNWKNGKLKF